MPVNADEAERISENWANATEAERLEAARVHLAYLRTHVGDLEAAVTRLQTLTVEAGSDVTDETVLSFGQRILSAQAAVTLWGVRSGPTLERHWDRLEKRVDAITSIWQGLSGD
jgi:hypothetical protein